MTSLYANEVNIYYCLRISLFENILYITLTFKRRMLFYFHKTINKIDPNKNRKRHVQRVNVHLLLLLLNGAICFDKEFKKRSTAK